MFLEGELAVAKALDWSSQGLDFADALHLASAGNAKRFATFNRKLAQQAKRPKLVVCFRRTLLLRPGGDRDALWLNPSRKGRTNYFAQSTRVRIDDVR